MGVSHMFYLHCAQRDVVNKLRQGKIYAGKWNCCIMFADLVGFTRISATLAPEEVGRALFCLL